MATQAAQRSQSRDRKPAPGLWREAFGPPAQEQAGDGRPVRRASLCSSSRSSGRTSRRTRTTSRTSRRSLANGGQPLPAASPGHLLGTDQIGRDLLSRLLDGARISMTVAIVVQIVVITIGVPVGAIAGWFGGRADNLLMRLTDVIYAFPDLLFIILLSVAFRETAFGKAMDGLLLVFVAIGLTTWVTVARLVRGQMLALKETEFVEAAKAIGVSRSQDRRREHLLPNGMGPIIVAITLGIPAAILAEATLAYIGIGVQPPRASWGTLVAEGQKLIRSDPAPRALPGDLHRDRADQLHLPRRRPARRAGPKLKGKQ